MVDAKTQEAIQKVDDIAQGLADSGGVRAFFTKVGNSNVVGWTMLGICLIVCTMISTDSVAERVTAETRKINAHAVSIEIQNEQVSIGNFGAGAVRVSADGTNVEIVLSPVANAVEYRVRYGVGGYQDIDTIDADTLTPDADGNITLLVPISSFGDGWDTRSSVNPAFVEVFAYDASGRSNKSLMIYKLTDAA